MTQAGHILCRDDDDDADDDDADADADADADDALFFRLPVCWSMIMVISGWFDILKARNKT